MGNKNSSINGISGGKDNIFNKPSDLSNAITVKQIQEYYRNPQNNANINVSEGRPILCDFLYCPGNFARWSKNNTVFASEGRVALSGKQSPSGGGGGDTMLVAVRPPGVGEVRVRVVAAAVNPADAQRTFMNTGAGASAAEGPPRSNDKSDRAVSQEDDNRNFSMWPSPSYAFPYLCGIEGSGIVESVGPTAEAAAGGGGGLRVGDRVMFLVDATQSDNGTFAQYVCLEADLLVKLPDVAGVNTTSPHPHPSSASPSEEDEAGKREAYLQLLSAAALPCAATAAYIALYDKLRVCPGSSVFIHGASGGVGSFAVQLAKFSECFVIATASREHCEYVKTSLGADVVLDYALVPNHARNRQKRNALVERLLECTSGYGADYILDCAPHVDNGGGGGRSEERDTPENLCAALRFGGHICCIATVLSPTSDFVFRRQVSVHHVFALAMVGSTNNTCSSGGSGGAKENGVNFTRRAYTAALATVAELFLGGGSSSSSNNNAGKLKVLTAPGMVEVVDYQQAREALEIVSQGHTQGKIVLSHFGNQLDPSKNDAWERAVVKRSVAR